MKISVDEAVHLFLTLRVHEVTRKTLYNNEIYLRSLKKVLGDRAIETITLDDLRVWRKTLFDVDVRYVKHNRRKPMQGGYSIYTLKGMVDAVKQLFNWLVREGYLESSPAWRLTAPRLPPAEPRSATLEDLNRMLAVAKKNRQRTAAARNVAVILFLRDSGCRLCGITGLRLHQLDLKRREALVYEKGRGGKSKPRMVFFKEETRLALKAWLKVRPVACALPGLDPFDWSEGHSRSEVNDFVFVQDRHPHRPLRENYISCMFRFLKLRAGVTGRVNPHSLRHGLAKRMLTNGATLGQVSRILGHSDIRVTDAVYGVFAQADLKEAHKRFA